MPQKFGTCPKGVLITCVGLLVSSLGVFVSILSVIVSPLFSSFSTPKPIFIGEARMGPTPRLQHPSQKIRSHYIHHPSSDKSSSRSSNTLSGNSAAHSIYSDKTGGNEPRRSPSPNGTRSRHDTYNASESPAPSRPPTPGLMSTPLSPSQPQPTKKGLRTYLGMRKRSTLLDRPTPSEPTLTADNHELTLKGSREQGFDRAEIIVSPPTPSSSIFTHSAPGPPGVRFGDVSTAGKPAARFVKSHSKRHSLSAACPRKRRSGKRSPNSPTPKSPSPAMSPVVESKWHVATRSSQRKKRKSLRIDPPRTDAISSVLIESGDDMGGEINYEEPISTTRPTTSQSPLTPARQGPVRTRPYEAPYFFPTPGSLEAIGYVERVLEERKLVLVHPDAMFVRNKKDPRRSFTMSSPETDGNVDIPKLRGGDGHDQAPEDASKKRPKSSGKGSGDRNINPSFIPADEFGVQGGAPTKIRKGSAPPQFPPFPDTSSAPTTSSRPQTQRQGSPGIMRILGKH
ncbi:hypothetical protein BDM02DRAFT_3181956 [Thelephora ganbajun]|uniref:Uncharacterized protein n=1 Tax=Thelephora ganbajun TaxID=370292 RepID=A0ACB6ZWB3_THEGA|nr:hypothetical protein BDM02DRAFT_3181956 [Thelephora ganbajun]